MVNGVKVAYELHGQGDPVALSPGGRYSMDSQQGVRELALALVQGGKRVLIWDRPNTGTSDICFDGDLESTMHADQLAGLIQTLELGKTTIVGGGSGGRDSLLAVIRHPDVASKLAVWWISSGIFQLTTLVQYYYGTSWRAAKNHGMKGVAALPVWQETLEKNPANRERMLAMDADEFAAKMEVWGPAFFGYLDSPLPGAHAEEFRKIHVPTLIFHHSASDLEHPRRTSEWLHELIPGSRLVEEPWGDNEWNERMAEDEKTGNNVLFASWPKLAPQLLEFMDEPSVAAH
jgi:pimeloyl-ACP methyl ester carboxylesterase